MFLALDSAVHRVRHRKRMLSSSGRLSNCSSCPGGSTPKSLGVNTPPPPENIAWLEHLRLHVALENVAASRDHVLYVLEVAHVPTRAHWRIPYTLGQYRAFQKQLLVALQHGHFCHAECPWLYSFLKSYFPRPSFLQLSKARTLEANRQSLTRCLGTLQSFLANRSNHCCSILIDAVADLALKFVNGERGSKVQSDFQAQALAQAAEKTVNGAPRSATSLTGSFGFVSRLSWSSQATPSPAETEIDSSVSQDTCGVCGNKLDDTSECESEADTETETESEKRTTEGSIEDARSSSSSVASGSSLSNTRRRHSTQASASASQRSRVYVMTLTCGHQFHDECIVSKLNESMTCPVCGRPEA